MRTSVHRLRLIAVATALVAAPGCSAPATRSLPPPPEFRPSAPGPAVRDVAASFGTSPIPPDEVVYFAFDSAELTAEAKLALAPVARWLRADPHRRLGVAAFTDPVGTPRYNLGLAARRARAVERYLTARGVTRERIAVFPRGEREADDTPHAVQRRVIVYARSDNPGGDHRLGDDGP